MKVKYNILNGNPPFIVVLSGNSATYTNNHNTIGNYEFLGVVDGTYSLKITDSISCVINYNNIIINNTNFVLNANSTGIDIDSINIYSGNTVSVKENNYNIDSLPLVADAATMTYDINYSLNTSVDIGNTSLSSFTVYKNGNQIFNDNIINNNTTGSLTVSLNNSDIIKVKLYCNTTKIGGSGVAIATINMSLSNFKINGNTYSSVNLSGTTKSLILN